MTEEKKRARWSVKFVGFDEDPDFDFSNTSFEEAMEILKDYAASGAEKGQVKIYGNPVPFDGFPGSALRAALVAALRDGSPKPTQTTSPGLGRKMTYRKAVMNRISELAKTTDDAIELTIDATLWKENSKDNYHKFFPEG